MFFLLETGFASPPPQLFLRTANYVSRKRSTTTAQNNQKGEAAESEYLVGFQHSTQPKNTRRTNKNDNSGLSASDGEGRVKIGVILSLTLASVSVCGSSSKA